MPVAKLFIDKDLDIPNPDDVAKKVRQPIIEILEVPASEVFLMLDRMPVLAENPPKNRAFLELLIFPGRSEDKKRRLLKELAISIGEALNIPAEETLIWINEPPLENWGIRGGQMAKDVC